MPDDNKPCLVCLERTRDVYMTDYKTSYPFCQKCREAWVATEPNCTNETWHQYCEAMWSLHKATSHTFAQKLRAASENRSSELRKQKIRDLSDDLNGLLVKKWQNLAAEGVDLSTLPRIQGTSRRDRFKEMESLLDDLLFEKWVNLCRDPYHEDDDE